MPETTNRKTPIMNMGEKFCATILHRLLPIALSVEMRQIMAAGFSVKVLRLLSIAVLLLITQLSWKMVSAAAAAA